MSYSIRISFFLTLFLSGILITHAIASDRPLLMAGKKSLYQRVLTIPDAKLYTDPKIVSEGEEIGDT